MVDTTASKNGVVFNIQKFSVHDGPGIRTIVFLKGCPLRCRWCCNPESQNRQREIMYVEKNCLKCGRCTAVCPNDAISFKPFFHVNYEKCNLCGKCIDVCYSDALEMAGQFKSVDEVIQELKKDNIHYRRSGGGITLSGGETMVQWEYAAELLKACKKNGWHTAIETTGFGSEKAIRALMPFLDLVLHDIKHMDEKKHKEYTGQSNKLILKNVKLISQLGVPLIIRVPVIPTFNDRDDEIEAIAEFASNSLGVREIDLLPYHRLGENKYGYLSYDYRMKGIQPPSKDKMEKLKRIVENRGLICKIGG